MIKNNKYSNKQISSDTAGTEEEVVVETKDFLFPEYGILITATSIEEAEALLKQKIEEENIGIK